jgi:hypothetical protein
MTSTFRVRLLLDFLSIGLIVACLAYWWLDNLSHELFGTALFLLVIIHNVFNRRWYGGVARGRRDFARWFNIATIFSVAMLMLLMLVTSLLISRDLFAFMSLDGAFAVSEIHMFAGYWLLFVIAVHLGTRWTVVMNVARGLFGISAPNAVRLWVLRVITVGIALWGIRSFSEMALGSKLMLSYSLDMWDFNESTIQFFLNYGSIVSLIAAVTHYGLVLFKALRPAR